MTDHGASSRPEGKTALVINGAPSQNVRRWKILREHLEAMRESGTKEVAAYHGEFVNFDPIRSYPKSIENDGAQIGFGSDAQKGPEQGAAHYDGWRPLGRM